MRKILAILALLQSFTMASPLAWENFKPEIFVVIDLASQEEAPQLSCRVLLRNQSNKVLTEWGRSDSSIRAVNIIMQRLDGAEKKTLYSVSFKPTALTSDLAALFVPPLPKQPVTSSASSVPPGGQLVVICSVPFVASSKEPSGAHKLDKPFALYEDGRYGMQFITFGNSPKEEIGYVEFEVVGIQAGKPAVTIKQVRSR